MDEKLLDLIPAPNLNDSEVQEFVTQNQNCLSYWFPKLASAGIPVPKTKLVHLSRDAHRAIFSVFDGKPINADADRFFESLSAAVDAIGRPCFLRTGQGSGKHSWKDTCYISQDADLRQHVVNLVEWSEMVDFMGLPVDIWAVREFLPTEPLMVCDRYGNMPVCREFRVFVRDGNVVCFHPYWPRCALEQGMTTLPTAFESRFTALNGLEAIDHQLLFTLATMVSEAIPGDWSVDILATSRGWYVTDMALASRSFHWDGCEKAKMFE